MKSFRRILRRIVLVLAVSVGTIVSSRLSARSAEPVIISVTTSADSGPGSFRAATELANETPRKAIIIKFDEAIDTVDLALPVYLNGRRITVVGNGVVIASSAESPPDLLVATNPKRLRVEDVAFRGGSTGVRVDLTPRAKAIRRISLIKVSLQGNMQHGLVIEEEAGKDNLASIHVRLSHCLVDDNGHETGAEGVRVNEVGPGNVRLVARQTTLLRNGHDGIQVEEHNDGDVTIELLDTIFEENGINEYAPGMFEYDDGLDVDELDAGDVVVTIVGGGASRNGKSAYDITDSVENPDDPNIGAGNLTVTINSVAVMSNGKLGIAGGIKTTELGVGTHTLTIESSSIDGSGKDGVNADEAGDGSLIMTLRDVQVGTHEVNDDDGVQATQTGTGEAIITLVDSIVRSKLNDDKSDAINVESPAGKLTLDCCDVRDSEIQSQVAVMRLRCS